MIAIAGASINTHDALVHPVSSTGDSTKRRRHIGCEYIVESNDRYDFDHALDTDPRAGNFGLQERARQGA